MFVMSSTKISVITWLIWKDPDAGTDWGQEEKGTTEDEIVGWHHQLNGHEFGWTLAVGDGWGGLVYWGSWGCKESDTTERLNWTELNSQNTASTPSLCSPLWTLDEMLDLFILHERKVKVKVKSLSHVRLFVTPWTVACQDPPSMELSRQQYWSGLPFLSPGDLPNPGIEPGSPTLQADALLSEPPGKPLFYMTWALISFSHVFPFLVCLCPILDNFFR